MNSSPIISTKRKTLIVVDPQQDFCQGGSLAVPGADAEFIYTLNELLMNPYYTTIVVTQDWHPHKHCSFDLWPVHCVQDTDGAEFPLMLRTDRANAIIRKGMNPDVDSYSAFIENDRRTETGLDGYLSARGEHAVDICGLALDYCVSFTAIDAAMKGYDVTILEYATKAIGKGEIGDSLYKARIIWDALGIDVRK